RILERHQAARDVVGVGAADRIMARDPARGGAVAGLAADAVALLEARAARSRRGAVAAQAHRRAARLADAEPLRDHLAARLLKDRISAAVRAGGARRILPQHDLVLADDRAVAFASAVAGGAAAAGDADEGGAARALGHRLGV